MVTSTLAKELTYKWTALGARLKAARIGAGLTQEDVANAQGVRTQMVWYWEAGRSRPSVNRLQPLAALYGVSVDSLVSEPPMEVLSEEDAILAEAMQALNSAAAKLTTEDIASIRDFIRFVQSRRRAEENQGNANG